MAKRSKFKDDDNREYFHDGDHQWYFFTSNKKRRRVYVSLVYGQTLTKKSKVALKEA